MPHSENRPCRFSVAAALLLGVLVAPAFGAAEPGQRRLHIESDPAGAEVGVIGGRAGVTPLTISERAIYPNDYPDDRAHLYGVITLRRTGCETLTHRVTLDDIERGLKLKLDCRAASPPTAAPATQPSFPAAGEETRSAVAGEGFSQRRLRQLQVLQELLDEGLIGSDEEQRIRRRLLQDPD